MNRARETITLAGMVERGAVTPRRAVTAADLRDAAVWLLAYEPDEDREVAVTLATVARWLTEEADRRDGAALERAMLRQLAKDGYDTSDPRVLAKAREVARRSRR